VATLAFVATVAREPQGSRTKSWSDERHSTINVEIAIVAVEVYLSGSVPVQNVAFYDSVRGEYICYSRTGHRGVRAIQWCTSKDVTNPLRFSGKQLTINYATSAAGSVRIEIQDVDGKALVGFSADDCPEHYGDSVHQTVAWKGGADVSTLAGKPVRLRFVIKDADLYSFQFVE
jgi:hypothetical protein